MKKYTTVSIPKTLRDTIEIRIEGTEFRSVSSYVTHLLAEIEAEIERMEGALQEEVEHGE